jgi:hypothetical protein
MHNRKKWQKFLSIYAVAKSEYRFFRQTAIVSLTGKMFYQPLLPNHQKWGYPWPVTPATFVPQNQKPLFTNQKRKQ